jgi:RimJ/RimL family protein N-acetyltransferase
MPESSRKVQPTLYTERLTLVPLADGHLELEVELDSDPEVMRYLTGRGVTRAEVEQSHRRRLAAAREVPGLGFWVGFAGDAFVGWWILQPPHGPDQPKVAGEADLGFRLLRRHWRRGFAGEGARELIRYGFAEVGLDRIFAQTMAANAASRATMQAAGLTFVRAFVSGEPYEDPIPGAEEGEVEYEITRATWQRSDRR